ncbi:FtsX-like permease family protein [Balneolaceae bacterium YR4-1]|uniref:FtsX-like permease family protein n=1 Tax=Halalkalibaculum roseum TaxID=2709311 RepID=A0A6M1TC27_9BACT|nr:ABC transporter permease [Halalkalibaculum roseum]NGP77683.1 FtsX-like permease family protein [Halalkalibaculum roseum]
MLKNYVKIAFRTFAKNKSFTFLSVLSLSVAIASVILIGLYARHEFSYDRFHEKSDRIYRLTTQSMNRETERSVGFVPLPLAPYLQENYAAVDNFARVWEYRRSMPVTNPEKDRVFYEDNFGWAEHTFFDIFDFEIIAGNAEDPLDEFRSVVISQSMAEKYFGNENPIGKPLYFQGETDIPLYVSAIMKDFPTNSHLNFDFIGNIKTAAEDFWAGGRVGQEFFDQWVNLFVPAYILVERGADLEPVLAEASRQLNNYFEIPGSTYEVKAQPITEIHLHSALDVGEWGINGSSANVYAVLIVGLIILLLGCFNFINLVTAQAGKRVKEVGLRKTLGGTRQQLMAQHYIESFLLVLSAVVLALVIVDVVQPWVSEFSGIENVYSILIDPQSWLIFAGFTLMLVLMAGAYPAVFVSKFSPSDVLNGTFSGHLGGGSLRKVLVMLQFALSGSLIVGTMVVYQQLQYMQESELGFAEEQVVVIPIHRDNAIIPNFDRVKQAYLQNSNVKAVTASSHLMFATFTYTNTFQVRGSDQDYRWERYTVEGDYPKVYDLNFIAGRSFRADSPADTNAVILNEQAVKDLGLKPDEVLGRIMINRSMGLEGEIVGVVQDFHYQSLHESIQPFVLINRPDIVDYISVKINPNEVGNTLDFLETTWKEVISEASFGYFFLDNTFAALYSQEELLNNAILSFSLIAIFLACLGLFGLSLFTAERRTKEIGVRKVLGATVWDIVQLLGSDFTKLVVLALFLAFPLSYLVMNSWLSDFAYRIEIGAGVFILSAIAALFIATVAVSYHSIKAALVNPVESLKSE